jgi:RHS repeat-associated protein
MTFRSLLLTLAAGLLAASPALAADKSSARPNVISVPAGPGSLEGLGESFSANLNSGSVRETVPLTLPPGTAGLTPQLALTYDSGNGNGPVGLGWSLGLSTIQLQTEKGLPRYDGTDRLLLDGAELVPLGGGVFRLKNEGRFLRVRRTGTSWEVDSPDGTLMRYGVSASARVESGSAVFSWSLEELVDRFGNRVLFGYLKDRGQVYLTQVDYNARTGAAANQVLLDYEVRPDVSTDRRARFPVTTGVRLRRVSAFSQGVLVRRFTLGYDVSSGLSLLSSVTQTGSDDASALPPVTFGYSPFSAGSVAVALPEALDAMPGPGSVDDEWIDVDGDGLVDMLHAESGSHWYALNLGGAGFGPRNDMPWSPSVALGSAGVEVADLDGDGIPDLVARLGATDSEWHWFKGTGAGEWGPDTIFLSNPPFKLEDPNVRLLDFDHDKLVDAVQSTADALFLWRNVGDGTWLGPYEVALPTGFPALGFADPKLKLADVTGDRLLDLVYVLDGSVTHWPSFGWGQFGEPVEFGNSPAPGFLAESALTLADVNGDGLSDLLWVAVDHVEVWPLLAGGAYGEPIVVQGTPILDPASTVIRLADMNGNGTADVVWSTPSALAGERLWYLDVSGDARPNLLVSVENGLGKRLELSYTTSTAQYVAAREAGLPWTTRVPFAVPVLGETRLFDGLGGMHQTTYGYADGWYAPDTREFRGFARGVRTEVGDASEATSVERHDFDLGASNEARKGLPLATEWLTAAGELLQRETLTWQDRVYATGTDGRQVAGADRVAREVEQRATGAAPVVTRDEATYDEFGNVLVRSEWGIVDGANLLVGGDERLTTTEYAHDTGAWLLGRQIRVLVTDGAGARLSEQRTYYDGEPFVGLAAGQLGIAGVPTRTEAWVKDAHWAQVQRVERDAWGQVIADLDPLGTRHEVDWDPDTHRYPVTERFYPAAGAALTFTASYDLAQGLLTSYRDPSGVESRFEWDALRHLKAIYRPGDPAGAPTLAFDYAYGNPTSRVVTRRRTAIGGAEQLLTHHVYDGLGRQLATVEQAEGGRTVVSGMRKLGLQGRPIREYEPFFSDGFDPPLEPATGFTAHAYDAMGRNVRSVLPDGSASERRYAPFAVEHWDAEDLSPSSSHAATPRTERSNALGVVEVVERLGAASQITRFERDALGRVARVVDANGLASTWHRDGLGRVDQIVHPDAGTQGFAYDDAGRLLERRDGRGALVATDYDGMGRPTLERLVDAAGTEEERVEYHYDAPSPRFPGDAAAGELAWVKDGAGEEHYHRDARGRLVEFVRAVDGKDYRLAYAFDAIDRLAAVTYPDGKQLTMNHNARGLLESIPGVISALEYDARGLGVRREHANGVVTTAAYDEMDRLERLATTAQGAPVQGLGYVHDRVGNVTRIDDELRPTGAQSNARTFAHDDLYRLLSAEGAGRTWTQAYDPAGSFRSKSGAGDYGYATGHQATSVGGKTYGYDAAGNCTSRPGASLAYDAKGRLKRVTLADGTVATYRYDYTGARVVKESAGPAGSHRTVYVDRLAEERDGLLSDYVFAGDERVARLGGALPSPVTVAAGKVVHALPPAAAGLSLLALLAAAAMAAARGGRRRLQPLVAAGMALAVLSASVAGCAPASTRQDPEVGNVASVHYHGDHLGGVALVTGASGELLSELSYGPWGERIQGSTEPYAFTGKEYEADTGLYDFGARAYDPAIGRFLSPDPATLADPELAIDDPQLLNPYSYARNAPANHVDRDGRLPHILAGALAGAVWGAGAYLVKAAVTGEFSAKQLGVATAVGAVQGAVIAATGGAGLLVSGALSQAAGGVVERGLTQGLSAAVNPKEIGKDLLKGAAGGVAQKALKAVAPVVKQVAAKAGQGLAKAGKVVAKAGQEVAKRAKAALTDGNSAPVKVIGRIWDTAVAKGWAGHEVLDIPNWTLKKNAEWISEGIKAGQNFYMASSYAGNMVQTSGAFKGQPTVFAMELEQLAKAGYRRIGDYLVHPNNVAGFRR